MRCHRRKLDCGSVERFAQDGSPFDPQIEARSNARSTDRAPLEAPRPAASTSTGREVSSVVVVKDTRQPIGDAIGLESGGVQGETLRAIL